jgi:hypothetical protein
MAVALLRGALRWIRPPARKRAVWIGCQAARVLIPPPNACDRQGVFVSYPRLLDIALDRRPSAIH